VTDADPSEVRPSLSPPPRTACARAAANIAPAEVFAVTVTITPRMPVATAHVFSLPRAHVADLRELRVSPIAGPSRVGGAAWRFRHSSRRVPETARIRAPPRQSRPSEGRPKRRERPANPRFTRWWSWWIAPRRSGVRVPLAPLREPLLRRGFSRFGALSGLGDFGYAGGDNGPDVPKLPVSARISGTKPAGGIRRSGRSTKAPG
jgi:hypothetical protein